MKTEDMIKYGAMLVAAYLLYRWITQPGATVPVAALPAPQTGDKPLTEIKEPAAPRQPTQLEIYNAALLASEASKTGNLKFTASGWNWYRARAAAQAGWSQDDIDKRAGADLGTDAEMTAVEYHALLKAAGLTGLGQAQSWGGGSMVYTN